MPQPQIFRVQHGCAVYDEDTSATAYGNDTRSATALLARYDSQPPPNQPTQHPTIHGAQTLRLAFVGRVPVDRRSAIGPSGTSSHPSGGSRTGPDGHLFGLGSLYAQHLFSACSRCLAQLTVVKLWTGSSSSFWPKRRGARAQLDRRC
jgi:hypothetical protein